MKHNLEVIGMDHSMPEHPASFRNTAEMPETPTARQNFSRLLRASQEVGYAAIAEAVGHHKPWVSRVLSGELKVSLAELLHWMDVTKHIFVHIEEATSDDAELLQMLLRKAARDLERRAHQRPGATTVTLRADEYQALVMLAKRGIGSMQAQTDGCRGACTDCPTKAQP